LEGVSVSKLLKLKEWLSKEESATLLGLMIHEKVTPDHIDDLSSELYIIPHLRPVTAFIGFLVCPENELSPGSELRRVGELANKLFCELAAGAKPGIVTLGPVPVSLVITVESDGIRANSAIVKAEDGNVYMLFSPSLSMELNRIFGDSRFALSDLASVFEGGDISFRCDEIIGVADQVNGTGKIVRSNKVLPVGSIVCSDNTYFTFLDNKRSKLEEQPSYRTVSLVVAALLDLLRSPGRNARNQSAVITEILELYPDTWGLKKRTLEGIFAAANKAKKEVE
jgi:hypothetical protein